MTTDVLVVLTCYSRPQNMGRVIRAWREQTVPCRIVVVDNMPPPKPGIEFVTAEPYPRAALAGCEGEDSRPDDVWRVGTNLGCPCHFYPAFAHFEYTYTMFADDDFLPGRCALVNLLGAAKNLDDKFSTIGETGRLFLLDRNPGYRYRGRSVPYAHPDTIVPCHITCRSHLVRTDLLYNLLPFRQKFLRFGEEGKRLVGIHDDFLLCLGLQHGTGYKSYIMGTPARVEDRLFGTELDTADDTTSLWKRPGHFAERNRMVDLSLEVGWKPL